MSLAFRVTQRTWGRWVGVVLLAGGMTAGAQEKATVSDAQVEANVLRALAGAPELSTQDIRSTTVYGVVTLSGSAKDEASRTKAEQLAARADGVKKVVDEMTVGEVAIAQAVPPAAEPQQEQSAVQDSTQQQYPQQAYPEQGAGGEGNQSPPPPVRRRQPAQRRPMYNQPSMQAQGEAGQQAGQQVTIPTGEMLRIRINHGLTTTHAQPGDVFDGTVLSDVVAGGAVAIPRGATVQGTVVNVEDAGALKGRGELALQLTRLTLGGQQYPITSNLWKRNGQDKTVHTVDSAVGLGLLGAVFGAVAGGGKGAAIGAGVGGAAGVASSAASDGGKVIIPAESVLTFHLAQAMTVSTVSEQEMARLSYAAGPGNGQPPVVRRRTPVYYAPYPYYGPYSYGPYYYGPYYGSRY